MRPDRRIAIALIVIGILIRLALAPWWAHRGDLLWFIRWAEAIQQHGLLQVYEKTSDANYPPLSMALIGAAAWLENVLGAGLSGEANLRLWRVLFKLPVIAADAGIAAVVWQMAKGRRGAIPLAATVVFNPALIYLTGVWGQFDSLYALAVLLAIWLGLEGRYGWSGAALGLGVMVKLQALAAAPVVGLIAAGAMVDIIRSRRAGPAAARFHLAELRPSLLLALGFALPILAGIAPLLLAGQLPVFAERLATFPEHMRGWLTINAHNLWYLATQGDGNWGTATLRSTDPFVSGLTYKAVGRIMLLAWTAAVCAAAWSARRERWTWLLAAALLYVGVFHLSTGMTERYLFAAVPLLAGAVAWSLHAGTPRTQDSMLALFGAMSLLHTLNLIWAAPALAALEALYAESGQTGMAIALGLVAAGLTGGWLLLRQVSFAASHGLAPRRLAPVYTMRFVEAGEKPRRETDRLREPG